MKTPLSIVPKLYLKLLQPFNLLVSEKFDFNQGVSKGYKEYFVKIVAIQTKEMNYDHRLEMVLCNDNGKGNN